MKTIKIIICILFVSAFAKAQQLQSFILEAKKNSPEIEAYNLRYNIALEKVNEADWIPNTEFIAGYFISEPETRTGAQRARFSVKQMLPWFGTITARKNYASSMAETEYLEIAIAERKLTLSVSQLYYKLYAIKAKQKVLHTNIQLLKTYEKLALTYLEVGKASVVDVLQLQIKQNELQQEKEVLDEAFSAEQISFNKLLNRDGFTTITISQTLLLPVEDIEYMDNDLKLNPELLMYDKLYESVIQTELLNKTEAKPKVGFGLEYIPVSERPNLSFDDNGKDILIPTLSASIPIFNRKYNSKSKQNKLKQLTITAQKANRTNVLESALSHALSNRNQARIIYNSQNKSIKQAIDAEEILIKNYETGTVNFNDILDIQELQLKFKTNQINALKDYYTQSALINYLTNKKTL